MFKKLIVSGFLTFALLFTFNIFYEEHEAEASTNGWVQSGSNWYYYENGVLAKGWREINNAWYYFLNDGRMAVNWQQINGYWYFFHPNNGNMQTGWLQLGANWFYLHSDGKMAVGWAEVNGYWYYFNSNGYMQTGWLYNNNSWFFLKADGKMAENEWLVISGSYYFFKKDGKMADDEWITDASGETYYIKAGGVGYTSWSNMLKGGKEYDHSTGRRLVYDVYSSVFGGKGFQIAYYHGSPYLEFQGWAVIFGHKPHNASNNATYIVAQNKYNPSKVIGYKTTQMSWSATEDLEYNKAASTPTTIWNECAAGVTNVVNNVCNMRYDNVGFSAWINLDELFPDPTKADEWELFIVKRVDDHMVWDRLILPFTLQPQSFKYGEVELTSRVNANLLYITASDVIKRTSAHQSGATGGSYGYFNLGTPYYTYGSNESSTVVWYRVWDTTTSSYRWAASSYWQFGGSQAVVSYTPEKNPPVHISHSMSYTYKNGNDYWVQPNTDVTIKLRQYDGESGNKSQWLRLVGSGQDAQAGHGFAKGTNHLELYPYSKYNHVSINSAKQLESGHYGQVEWTVNPKTHGHTYDVGYWYEDNALNSIGYHNTGMRLRVDGVTPYLVSKNLQGAKYVKGNTYWVKPNDTVSIQFEQKDDHSGNSHQYIKLEGSGVDVRSSFTLSNNRLLNYVKNDNHLIVNSATHNNTWSKVNWSITPKSHGHTYDIYYSLGDNVINETPWINSDMDLAVDGHAPVIKARNEADTSDLTSGVWDGETIKVRLKFSDSHSGYKNSSYQWSQSKTPSSNGWSSLQTSSNYVVTQSTHGTWYLHVQAQDNVGNIGDGPNAGIRTFGPYTNIPLNQPPIAKFEYSPDKIYNNTTVKFTNLSSDPDGDSLTYKWEYKKPNSSKWEHFSNVENPSRVFDVKGTWTIRLTVNDGKESASYQDTLTVLNRNPVADFEYQPTSNIYNDTTIQFINKSYDPDNDTLTYKWEYRSPSNNKWVEFSKVKDPKQILNETGEWIVKLTVNDGDGGSDSVEKTIKIENRKPEVTLSYNPEQPYEGDTVKICVVVYDPDGHKTNVEMYLKYKNGSKQKVLNKTDVTSGSKLCYEYIADPGKYEVEVKVTDGFDDVEVTTWFNVKELIIKGHVNHTEEWEKIHLELGHSLDKFFSGEKFLLKADISNYPAEYVTVTFNGTQANGLSVERFITLSKVSSIVYKGELYDESFINYPTNLEKGPAYFTFEVKYTNGVIKQDVVQIEIIDDAYSVYKLHRKY